MDYQFNASTSQAFASRDAMAAFQGKVFFVAQIVAFLVQIFVTSTVHKKFGVIIGLCFLPLALLTGSIAFLVAPFLSVIAITIGSETAFSYSIHQASKEILYVPLDKVSKFKGKAFIDMFVYRGAKAFGAGILLLYTLWLSQYGVTSRILMVLSVIGIVIWMMSIWNVRKGLRTIAPSLVPTRALPEGKLEPVAGGQTHG